MKVVFTTPTAAPPAWLTQKYPEVLNHTRTGIPFGHGGRRNYTYNSPRYRELCAIIVERIAQRYGPNPLIIGWQIDNELNCEASEFYSRADEEAFRVFLKRKYKTLNALNDAWGCVCWGTDLFAVGGSGAPMHYCQRSRSGQQRGNGTNFWQQQFSESAPASGLLSFCGRELSSVLPNAERHTSALHPYGCLYYHEWYISPS